MPTVLPVLNQYVRKLARREAKALTSDTKKRLSEHRRFIATLKRELHQMRSEVASLRRHSPKSAPAVPGAMLTKARLRIDGLKRHRQSLELSARDYGKLLGVSALTVYNWENRKSKPRKSQLAKIVGVRGI